MKFLTVILFLWLINRNLADQNKNSIKTEDLSNIEQNTTWSIQFSAEKLITSMLDIVDVELVISNVPTDLARNCAFQVLAKHTDLLHVNMVIPINDVNGVNNEWRGNVSMEGLFLGQTKVYVVLLCDNQATQRADQELDVIILRNIGGLDTAFKLFVGGLVMVLFINFGAAIDTEALKDIVIRPVGPTIGFVTKFLIMPILGYLIGYYIFREEVNLRLGLFFTAVTPAGGSSNIFTALLDGNLNLSIAMTAISNLLAFIMMPIWIFTLGALIFNEANFVIPYVAIISTSFSLVLPLIVGILLKKYKPQYVSGMVRYLKTFSLLLIFIIMVFTCYINSYIFKLFSLKIIMASATLSWSGFFFGWLVAKALRQSQADALTIAIETGIENTGIAMFMLNFSLPQPSADITSAVPIANAMMTPLPLLLMYIIQKCCCRYKRKREDDSEQVKEEQQLSEKTLQVLPPITEIEDVVIMAKAKTELEVY